MTFNTKANLTSSPIALVEKTVSIEKKTIEIEERGVKLRLTVVDTPGKSIMLDSI